MKTESRKIHRNFKLAPAMDARLRKVLEALRHFRRSLTIDQRRALFASGRKTVGRPVEVKAA